MTKDDAMSKYHSLLEELRVEGSTGLDLSPGDHLAANAYLAMLDIINALPEADCKEETNSSCQCCDDA